MRHLPTFLVFLASVLVAAPHNAPAPKLPIVFTEIAKADEIFDTLTYPARIVPLVNANVLSETEGIVENILVSLGTPVKRGQTLFTVRNTDPVYEYAPARVQSSVAGVVSSIEVTKGSRITRGQKLGAVTDPTKIKVLIEVAASDLDAVRAGLEGSLILSQQTEPMPAKIAGVSPFVDPATGTASAEIQLGPSKTNLSPGLVGKMRFKVRSHQGIQVPDSAITFRGMDPFIRLVVSNKAKYQAVKLGRSRRGHVEVLEGLKNGDVIIARASSYISDGEEVTVEKPGAKLSE